MMNQLSISEYNPRMEYCDKFQFDGLVIYKNNIRIGKSRGPCNAQTCDYYLKSIAKEAKMRYTYRQSLYLAIKQ